MSACGLGRGSVFGTGASRSEQTGGESKRKGLSFRGLGRVGHEIAGQVGRFHEDWNFGPGTLDSALLY